MHKLPRIEITYCTGCRWMLRATWIAQELLTTFQNEIGEIALQPGQGGIFNVKVNEETVWSRTDEGGFPEIKVLKQRVRDIIAPQRELRHSDK